MGKSSGKLLRELIADTSPLLGGFNVEEFFPFLARFGVLSKVVRARSERLRKRWDELLDGLIDDHESMYEMMAAAAPASELKDEDEDFIHILLSVQQEYGLTRESMKAILLFLPFSAGRRQCPGINFGMAAVEVMLANLVHRFDWEMPAGKAARDIDMSEEFGLVVHRKEKLLLEPKLCAVGGVAPYCVKAGGLYYYYC